MPCFSCEGDEFVIDILFIEVVSVEFSDMLEAVVNDER
jgi:hypothetical protein